MNEKNIEALKARLVLLGFEPSVESLLRCNACFMVGAFDLSLTRLVGRDQYLFTVHIEKNERDLYEVRYYSATLRKEVMVGAEFVSLDAAMGSVDWGLIAEGKLRVVSLDAAAIGKAFDVLRRLQELGSAADILKYKYWSGMPMESSIGNLAGLKSEWELSERFYFFDETLMITFADAIRFLSSRWLEKQFAVKRKLLVKREINDRPPGGVAGGKLLTKNPRRLNRRGVDKS